MPTFTPMTLETLPSGPASCSRPSGWRGSRTSTSATARGVLPVTFAVEGDAVWSAIDEKPKRTPEPARLRYLRRRPEAALLVDVYDDDWSRLAWVQLLGRVDVRAGGPRARGDGGAGGEVRAVRGANPAGAAAAADGGARASLASHRLAALKGSDP